jgi:hypothetical protein
MAAEFNKVITDAVRLRNGAGEYFREVDGHRGECRDVPRSR